MDDRRREIIASGSESGPERNWLFIRMSYNGTVSWVCTSGNERTISYRKNGGKWTKITSTTSGYTISCAKNDRLEFKGNNANYGGNGRDGLMGSHFTSNNICTVGGDIMTMLGSDTLSESCFSYLFSGLKVTTATTLDLPTSVSAYCYAGMFSACSSLTTAPALPATTMAEGCYKSMFQGCTKLTKPPVLPATTLASYCYQNMFYVCTSLKDAPELPATTLAEGCYNSMFRGCTSLTEAPELPAYVLVTDCYSYMFYGCSKLSYIRSLFRTPPSTSYTDNWVYGVASNGLYDKNSQTWNVTGVNGVPTGWIISSNLAFIIREAGTIVWRLNSSNGTAKTIQYSKNSASSWISITSSTSGVSFDVSAGDVILWKGNQTQYTTSSFSTYSNNFIGTATFIAVGNIMSLVNNSSSFSANYTFAYLFYQSNILSARYLRLPATTLIYACYQCMFSSCASLTSAPKLPATTLANSCYSSMFSSCTSLTTAPELPVTTLKDNCYASMFIRCSALTTAPELPATTLIYACYQYMFNSCTSLTKAPKLPASTLAQACYFGMFKGCSKLSKVTCLATDVSANQCLYQWLDGVKSGGTFIKAAEMTSWPSGTGGIPSSWTVEDYVEE